MGHYLPTAVEQIPKKHNLWLTVGVTVNWLKICPQIVSMLILIVSDLKQETVLPNVVVKAGVLDIITTISWQIITILITIIKIYII